MMQQLEVKVVGGRLRELTGNRGESSSRKKHTGDQEGSVCAAKSTKQRETKEEGEGKWTQSCEKTIHWHC